MSDEDKERLGHAGKVLVAGAPALPDASYPKDDWVVERCVQEKSEGRGVMVFTTQNHRRGVQARLKRRLEDAGLRVEILEASVSPEKREEWLVKARKRGFDVLLTNGKLVETGLDILEAVTIIQYGTEFSLSTLRQSIRRSWRIGQDRPVRVFMLAQERTMQESAAKLIASKMRAAEAVDGDEAGGLAQVSSGENLLVEIAMDFLEKHAK
jgi:superfamily II DNA or RNA helicase